MMDEPINGAPMQNSDSKPSDTYRTENKSAENRSADRKPSDKNRNGDRFPPHGQKKFQKHDNRSHSNGKFDHKNGKRPQEDSQNAFHPETASDGNNSAASANGNGAADLNSERKNDFSAKNDKKNNFQPRQKFSKEDESAETLPEGPVTVVGINFRSAGKIYYFSPKNETLKIGQRVIVETSRGLEMGTVKIANTTVDGSEVTAPLREVIRVATAEDLERDDRNHELEMDAAVVCKKKIREHGLTMKLVDVAYTFDNSKLTFYFTCESRVDFRELVRDLASTFHIRIELHQIGIRDEAKMMGGLGLCGRKYCCSGFLQDFIQVPIKTAKMQNFSLNSTKASGACGRLMCCLRYEQEVYEEALKIAPPTGTLVETKDGNGTVTENRPLAAEVKVRLADADKNEIRVYPISEIKVLRLPAKKNDQKNSPKDRSESADGEDSSAGD